MRLRSNLTPTVLSALLAAAAGFALASPAAAQQSQPSRNGQTLGLRYLTWAGKTERTAPLVATPAAASNAPRPAAIIPRYASAPVDAPPPQAQGQARETRYGPARVNGLTPASAWLSAPSRAPAPVPYAAAPPPAYAPTPAPALPPPPYAAPPPAYAPAPLPAPAYRAVAEAPPPPVYRPAPAPVPRPMPAPPPPPAAAPVPAATVDAAFDPMAPRRDAPIFRMRSSAPPEPPVTAVSPDLEFEQSQQPTPQPQSQPQPADPMAPRRDAPIFRMQGAAAAPTAAAQPAAPAPTPAPTPTYAAAGQPVRDSARYYSVHRAAGRQPDATAMPTSVYLDHAPLNLTSTPTSTDLAEPPAAPAVTRTVNGRAQVVTPNEDPSLP